jgi:hypothetical protein
MIDRYTSAGFPKVRIMPMQCDYIFVKDEMVETIVDGPNGKVKFFFQQGRFLREE